MAFDGNHYPETIEECWAEIDRLRAYLPSPKYLVRRRPFQPKEWIILVLASRKDFLRYQEIYNAMYADCIDQPDPENIKVQVSKIRARLRSLGIDADFECVPTQGYGIVNREAIAAFVNRTDLEQAS